MGVVENPALEHMNAQIKACTCTLDNSENINGQNFGGFNFMINIKDANCIKKKKPFSPQGLLGTKVYIVFVTPSELSSKEESER